MNKGKYKFVRTEELEGFQEVACNCPAAKPSGEIHQVDKNLLLLYKGTTRTTINGYLVFPGHLVLDLTSEDFEVLKNDRRFTTVLNEEAENIYGRFGKV